jgi:hypothetical protein
MNILLFDLISYFGIGFIFLAYSLNRFIKLNRIVYNIFNVVGGILLTVYSAHTKNTVFLILNIVWSIIGIIDIINDLRKGV